MPEVKLTLDAAQYLMAMAEAGRAEQKQEANMRKSSRAAAEWEREEKRAAEASKQRSVERAQQSYNELAAEQRLHAERQRAYTEMGQKLDAIAAKNRAAFQVSQSAAQQQIAGLQGAAMMPPHLRHQNMIFDPMRAYSGPGAGNALRMYREELNRAKVAAREAQQALKAAGKAGEEGFGSQALTMIGQYAAGMVSIYTAVNLVRGQFDKMDELRQKALASLSGVQDSNAKLAQLPGFAENAKARDEIYQKYGLPRDEATDLIYAAKSGDLSKEQIAFAARAGQLGPGVGKGMAEFETSIKNTYPGYSPQAGGNLALKIAADSPKLEFGDVVTGVPASLSATGKHGLNMSLPQTMAIIEKMSLGAGTPTEALERFEVLAGRLSIDKRFRGRGKQAFDDLAKMSDEQGEAALDDVSDLSSEDAEKFLGKRKELRQAIRMYRMHQAEIPGYTKELEQTAAATGTTSEEVEARARDRFRVPSEAAELERRKSENTATVTREGQLGVQTSQAARMMTDSETAARKRGDSQWSTAGAQGGAVVGRYTGGRPIDVAVGAAGGKFIAEGGGLGALAGKYQEGLGTGLLYTNPIGLLIASFERLHKVTEEQKEILNQINASNKDMANQTPRIPAPNPNGGGRR